MYPNKAHASLYSILQSTIPNPRISNTSLHNHAASFLELAHDFGQDRIDDLLNLVLLVRLLPMVRLVLLARVVLMRSPMVRNGGHDRLATGQVDINPASVLFSGILQAEIAADLLNPRLDLLNVVDGMIPLADDAVRRSAATHI